MEDGGSLALTTSSPTPGIMAVIGAKAWLGSQHFYQVFFPSDSMDMLRTVDRG